MKRRFTDDTAAPDLAFLHLELGFDQCDKKRAVFDQPDNGRDDQFE